MLKHQCNKFSRIENSPVKCPTLPQKCSSKQEGMEQKESKKFDRHEPQKASALDWNKLYSAVKESSKTKSNE